MVLMFFFFVSWVSTGLCAMNVGNGETNPAWLAVCHQVVGGPQVPSKTQHSERERRGVR